MLSADYSNTVLPLDSGWSFDKDKLQSAIRYLIENTYIEFGSLILRQVIGIPMGAIPAPDFANLALAVD